MNPDRWTRASALANKALEAPGVLLTPPGARDLHQPNLERTVHIMTDQAAFTEDQIIAIGGNLWARGDRRRDYLNHWAALAGIRAERYNSGNICYAEIDGEQISNTRAYKLLSDARVYREDGKIYTDDLGAVYFAAPIGLTADGAIPVVAASWGPAPAGFPDGVWLTWWSDTAYEKSSIEGETR